MFALAMTVKLNTEALNRNGYRILSGGIDFKAFKSNPVLLLQHDDWSAGLPIGKVNNLRLDGDALVGDLEFDAEDELAMKVKGKFDRGYLNAVSMAHSPISVSDDPKLLLKGQRRATVTQTELLELSVVKVPGNGQAVRLAAGPDKLDELIPTLEQLSHKPGAAGQNSSTLDFKNIALKLGLAADADEATITKAIDGLNTQLAATADQRATDLVEASFKLGAITEAEKPLYLKLAKADYASTAELLSARKPAEQGKGEEKGGDVQLKDVLSKVGAAAVTTGAPSNESDAAKYERLRLNNHRELDRLEREDFPAYEKLAAAWVAEY